MPTLTRLEIELALARLLDMSTCERVVSALAQVCREKHERNCTDWMAPALLWDIAAKRLDKAAEGIHV